jgi:L-iditol 2-dehydrogenase
LKSVLIDGPDRFSLGDVALGEVPPGHLLLAPLLVGICGTDLELFSGSMIYLRNGMAQYPVIPGHEWVAVVVEVGPGVLGFAAGDRVVGEVSIGCGSCTDCETGNYHRCASRSETGFMGLPGALRERMLFPASSAHLVPVGVDNRDAALAEPLAVAFQAVRKADIHPGDRVLVVGAGTIGMLVAMVLRSAFDCTVFVLSDRADRTQVASGLGFSIHQPGTSYPRVIEAAGGVGAVADAISALAPGGRLVVTGLSGQESVSVPMDSVVVNDQEIVGSLGSPGVWPEVLNLLAGKKLRPSDLVTHVFSLDEIDQAIALARSGSDSVGKILVRVNEEAPGNG